MVQQVFTPDPADEVLEQEQIQENAEVEFEHSVTGEIRRLVKLERAVGGLYAKLGKLEKKELDRLGEFGIDSILKSLKELGSLVRLLSGKLELVTSKDLEQLGELTTAGLASKVQAAETKVSQLARKLGFVTEEDMELLGALGVDGLTSKVQETEARVSQLAGRLGSITDEDLRLLGDLGVKGSVLKLKTLESKVESLIRKFIEVPQKDFDLLVEAGGFEGILARVKSPCLRCERKADAMRTPIYSALTGDLVFSVVNEETVSGEVSINVTASELNSVSGQDIVSKAVTVKLGNSQNVLHDWADLELTTTPGSTVSGIDDLVLSGDTLVDGLAIISVAFEAGPTYASGQQFYYDTDVSDDGTWLGHTVAGLRITYNVV